MATEANPFDRELLPLLPKECWEDTLVTVTGSYECETQFGRRIVLETITFNDCSYCPRGEHVAIMFKPTIVREKFLSYFASGGKAVGPCRLFKNDKGTWVVQMVKAGAEDDA